MRIQHQENLAEKDTQIQAMTDKFKCNSQIDKFIKEALSLNSLLMQQKEVLFQKISQIDPYYEASDKLANQVIDMRLEYGEIHKRISEFITSQECEDGRNANLPKQEESHKDILFMDWDSLLKQGERETTIAVTEANNIIEAINKNLHGANHVMECILGFPLNVKVLEQQWKEVAQEKEEAIRQVYRLNW